MIWSLTKPSEASLERLRASQAGQQPTYVEVGATLGPLPPGYGVLGDTLRVGTGVADFHAACEALRAWAPHRALGMTLAPRTPPLVEGTTMAFALPVLEPLPLWITGCCRIVRVVDTHDGFGFAYGTLPHHPERGEEAFLVRRRDDGSVVFEITAFSRPASLLVRLSGPIGRWMQRRSVRAYLRGLRPDSR